jgi:MFS family permease
VVFELVGAASKTVPATSLPKVAFAAFLGGFVEWYDFFLAASAAALVWPALFFPSGDVVLATAFSISAYAVTFFSRPIGAIVFGHYGDVSGRRTTLVVTLSIMGISVLAIALLPTYSTIGIWAPVLLIVFRLLFGFGLGGEFGGAISWVAEYAAKSKWRAFWTGCAQLPIALGIGASTLAFAFTLLIMPRQAFLDTGWRVLFGIGAVVLVVGVVIRYRLAESPLFERMKEKKETIRMPAFQVLRERPGRILLLALIYTAQVASTVTLITPIGLGYFAAKGLDITYLTFVIGSVQIVFFVFGILGPVFSDIIGRKKMMLIANLLMFTVVVIYYFMTASPNPTLVLIALVVENFNFGSTLVSVWMSEQFETKYRYSGSGLSYQIGGFIAGAITSFLVPYLITSYRGIVGTWPILCGMVAALFLIATVATLGLRETRLVPLD